MSIRNMREHGAQAVLAIGLETRCGRSGSSNVDSPPEDSHCRWRAAPAVLGVRLFEKEGRCARTYGRGSYEPRGDLIER
jgi:hypothetical protein